MRDSGYNKFLGVLIHKNLTFTRHTEILPKIEKIHSTFLRNQKSRKQMIALYFTNVHSIIS